MTTTLDVETIATDADLEVYAGGRSALQDLLPDEWFSETLNRKSAALARQQAFEDIAATLRQRRPPIRDTDLTDPNELKPAVCYGALAIIYSFAATHEDSPHVARGKSYAARFSSEKLALQPSVTAGSTSSSLSIRMSRG
jgi:hypothetical protein